MNRSRYFLGVVVSALIVCLAGCDDGGGGSDARIRLINAATGQAPISLFVDADAVTTQAFGEASGYNSIDEGNREIRGVSQPTDQELFRFTSRFDNDIDYSLYTVVTASGVDPVLIVDENNRPDPGNFRIHAVHAAAGVSSVDIYVLREGVPLAGQSPTFSTLSYSQASGYDQIDQNKYVVYVTRAGTRTVIASETVDFENFEVWTAAVINNGSGVTLKLIRDRD